MPAASRKFKYKSNKGAIPENKMKGLQISRLNSLVSSSLILVS